MRQSGPLIFSRGFKPPQGYSGATVTNRTVNRSINRRHHYTITADKIGLWVQLGFALNLPLEDTGNTLPIVTLF
jgi:hypothetical protein